jgi:hypothetical protein
MNNFFLKLQRLLLAFIAFQVTTFCSSPNPKPLWGTIDEAKGNLEEWCNENNLYYYTTGKDLVCLDINTGRLKWKVLSGYHRLCPEKDSSIFIPIDSSLTPSSTFNFINKINKNNGLLIERIKTKYPFTTINNIGNDTMLLCRSTDNLFILDYYLTSDFSFQKSYSISYDSIRRWKVLFDKVFLVTEKKLIILNLKASPLNIIKGEFNPYSFVGVGNGIVGYERGEEVTKYSNGNSNSTFLIDSTESLGMWSSKQGVFRSKYMIAKIDTLSGRIIWQEEIQNLYSSFHIGEPPIWNDSMFIIADKKFKVLDSRSGKILFEQKAPNRSQLHNSFYHKGFLINREDDSIFCYKIDFK